MGISRSTTQSPQGYLSLSANVKRSITNLTPFDESLPQFVDLLNDYGTEGGFSNGPSVLLIGDSITEGANASSYVSGYAYMLARSLWNWRDYGYDLDRGFGYQSTVNLTNFANEPNCGWNGVLQPTGLVGNRVTLANTKLISLQSRRIDFCDVVYNATNSTGNIVIKLNTTTVATIPVSGSGLQATGPTPLGITTSESDTITIVSSGGSLEICAVLAWRQSTNSPTMYVAGKTGWGYQDFDVSASMDEMAFYLNWQRAASEKIVIFNLGTNNIYNSGKALSPAAMLAHTSSIIAGINARCSPAPEYIMSVPPRTNESLAPVILAPTYAYSDYVNAIVAYARTNNIALARHDKSQLGRVDGLLLTPGEGIHPTTLGHRVMCRTFCKILGIPFNPYVKTTATQAGLAFEVRSLMTYNSTWRAFTNNPTFNAVAHLNGNVVNLSGTVEPNGSVSLTIGNIPAQFRPINRNCDFMVYSNSGAVHLKVSQTGDLTVDSVAGITAIGLDGVTFSINSAYGL
jgi:lysophospholipase L1-like esterase